MADLTDLSALNELLESVSNKASDWVSAITGTNGALEDVKKTSDSVTSSLEKQALAQKEITKEVDKTGFGFDSLSQGVLGIQTQIQQMVTNSGLDSLNKKVDFAATAFSLLGTVVFGVGESLKGVNAELDLMGDKTANTVVNDFGKLQVAVEKFGKMTGLQLLPETLSLVVKKLAEVESATGAVKQLENSLMGVRSQYGGFQEAGSKTDFIENLSRETSRFNETIEGTATSLNMGIDEVQKYAFDLMKIPGAFDQIVETGDQAGEKVRFMEQAMRIARGTTGSFKDSIDAINLEFKQFGTTSMDSLDYLSRMYTMSQSLGVSFGDFRDTVKGIVERFSSLGNTSKEATELVGGLAHALTETGIGIGPTKRIIDGIASSMENMGLAQKAFLSQQTGGAGGLRGAFQIDQMVAEGNIRGVYDKMEQALRQQFGGRIVTREEASQSDVAASQMAKQLAFLQQGPFGKMVGSTGDAYKLLEAFQKGTGPTQDMINRGEGALSGALQADKGIQTQQRDAMVDIMNNTKALFRESQIHTALWVREKTGKEGVATLMVELEDAAKARAAFAGKSFYQKGENDEFEYNKERQVLSRMERFGENTELLKTIGGRIGDSLSGIKPVALSEGIAGSAPRINAAGQTLPNEGPMGNHFVVDAKLPERIELVLVSPTGTEIARGTAVPNADMSKAIGGKVQSR